MHCSTGNPHDTQIGWQTINPNRQNEAVPVLWGEKGSDWSYLRQRCRDAGARPVLEHREFTGLD